MIVVVVKEVRFIIDIIEFFYKVFSCLLVGRFCISYIVLKCIFRNLMYFIMMLIDIIFVIYGDDVSVIVDC